jgi:hypothetical protein
MQEYTIVYKDGLANGLRKSEHNPKNVGALIRADGIMQEAGELSDLPDIDKLDLSVIGACTHPFPQVFQLKAMTVVCTHNAIYTLAGSSLTLVYSATEGSTWTVADFTRFILFSNGRDLVKLDGMTGEWSKFIECHIPYCLCLCDVNGQVFMGGPECSVTAGWLGE